MISLAYDWDDAPERNIRRMPVRGFRATAYNTGFVEYGGLTGCVFDLNASRRPYRGALGAVIDPVRNLSLLEVINRVDRSCQTALDQSRRLQRTPSLPRILLAFPPDRPPAYEDTPALRRLTALEMGCSEQRLGSTVRNCWTWYCADVWQSQQIPPDDPRNGTGALLVNADVCMQPAGVLKVYEDFSALLGVPTTNPARGVAPFQLPQSGCRNLGQVSDRYEPGLCPADLGRVDRRIAAGDAGGAWQCGAPVHGRGTPGRITKPHEPLNSWRQVLPKLRSRLSPFLAECSTDEDLLRETAHLDKPLVASGACRVQVIERRSDLGSDEWRYSPEDLGRRIEVNFDAELQRSGKAKERPLALAVS